MIYQHLDADKKVINIIMKKDTQHIKYGKIIQRSTGTKL